MLNMDIERLTLLLRSIKILEGLLYYINNIKYWNLINLLELYTKFDSISNIYFEISF